MPQPTIDDLGELALVFSLLAGPTMVRNRLGSADPGHFLRDVLAGKPSPHFDFPEDGEPGPEDNIVRAEIQAAHLLNKLKDQTALEVRKSFEIARERMQKILGEKGLLPTITADSVECAETADSFTRLGAPTVGALWKEVFALKPDGQ